MENILLWQLEVFILAFFVLSMLSSLNFYAKKSRIEIIRVGFVAIGILTLLAALPFKNNIQLYVDSGSAPDYFAGIFSSLSQPLVMVLAAIVSYKLVSAVYQYALLRRNIGSHKKERSGKAFQHLNQLCNQLRISDCPSLYVVPNFEGACTFGHRKPIIVMSEKIASDPSKTHIALLHELNHISQKDWIWDQVSRFIGIMFPLDALVRNLGNKHHRLIEQHCDHLCTEQGVDNLFYASFLHGLKRNQLQRSAVLQAAELSNVGERVEMLISNAKEQPRLSGTSSLGLSILILSLALIMGTTRFELNINEPRTPYTAHVQFLGHEIGSKTEEKNYLQPMTAPEKPSLPLSQGMEIPAEIPTEVTLSAPQHDPPQIEPP